MHSHGLNMCSQTTLLHSVANISKRSKQKQTKHLLTVTTNIVSIRVFAGPGNFRPCYNFQTLYDPSCDFTITEFPMKTLIVLGHFAKNISANGWWPGRNNNNDLVLVKCIIHKLASTYMYITTTPTVSLHICILTYL